MAWGSAQEASALFSLMHLYPNSQLEEVGLCWLDPRQQIPASWGIAIDDLPPLGASPDGLIRHKANSAPPPPTELPAPTSLLNSTSQSDTASQHAEFPTQSVNASQSAEGGAAAVAPPAVNAEFQALLAKLAISAQQAPAWNSNPRSGNTSLPASQPAPANSDAYAALPATAHAQRLQMSNNAVQSAAPSAGSPIADLQQHEHAASLQQPAAGIATGVNGSEQHDWFEAVEIKNVCPFRELQQSSSNGKVRRVYHLSDSGPYSRVSCL